MSHEEGRHFTLEEANAMIPELTRLMREIQLLRGEMVEIIGSKLELSKGNGKPFDSTSEVMKDLSTVATTAARIRDLVEAIQETGVEVKDIDQGIVDFKHSREGRTVYLCWKMGENRIDYWHELDAGFKGRQPL